MAETESKARTAPEAGDKARRAPEQREGATPRDYPEDAGPCPFKEEDGRTYTLVSKPAATSGIYGVKTVIHPDAVPYVPPTEMSTVWVWEPTPPEDPPPPEALAFSWPRR